MKYLIIESHPYEGSFNAGAAKEIQKVLEEKGHSVRAIHLVEDGFNPVMTGADLKAWTQAQSIDPLVSEYQNTIRDAEILVFPFPIWWGTMPAILKGFLDKVFLPGFAYHYNEQGEIEGLLTDKKAVVITTMETPVEFYRDSLNNPIVGEFNTNTLKKCGIDVLKHFQIDHIVSGGRVNAEAKLAEIVEYFKK